MNRVWLGSLAATLALAQTTPAFDVASVKSEAWTGKGSVGVFIKGDTLNAEHTCLYGLVEFAFNLKDGHLSGGPAWARCGLLDSSDLYQVMAKAPGGPPPSTDQFRVLLQGLLADRFQLRVHHVQKDFPMYNLVASERGVKLKESSPETKFSMRVDARLNRGRSMRMVATHASIAQLLGQFEHAAGRPVFDHSGMTGFYDFELAWDLDTPTADAATSEATGELFPGALQKELGLKLEPGTAPFDTVVIDHAAKPSQN